MTTLTPRSAGSIVLIALITAVASVAITTRAAAATADSAAVAAVIALETARGRALTAADTSALAAMTADEFVEVSRIGTLRTKADNIRELGSGMLKLDTVKYDDLAVQVYGDVAILRGIADNTGTFRGLPFTGKLRYTRVFVKRGGRWQAVAMQHTLLQ